MNPSSSFPRLALVLLLAALTGWVACGDDSSTPASSEPSADGSVDPNDPCAVAATPAERDYRITSLRIRQPGTLNVLQGLIQAEIDEDILHVVIRVRNFADRDGSAPRSFEITGNAGQRTGDEDGAPLTWSDDVAPEDIRWRAATVQANGTFENLETLDLIFPANLPAQGDEPPQTLALPLKEISIEGAFVGLGDNCVPAIAGRNDTDAILRGAILEEDIGDLTIDIGTGERQLTALLGTKNYPDGVDPAERTGWILTASIRAEEIVFVERD